MTWKIVSDSGCDYRELEDIALETSFESVPLTIQVGEEVFIDNAALDIDTMMDKMYATSTASKSACPSPDDYLQAFAGADNIFVVTITGTLSGSHNSAQVAKKLYLEENPNVNIHVIDSLSAGGEVDLIVSGAAGQVFAPCAVLLGFCRRVGFDGIRRSVCLRHSVFRRRGNGQVI